VTAVREGRGVSARDMGSFQGWRASGRKVGASHFRTTKPSNSAQIRAARGLRRHGEFPAERPAFEVVVPR